MKPQFTRQTFLCVERLEDRTVPYSMSGSKWASLNVSASYVPDGTIVQGGYASTLNQIYDAKFQTAPVRCDKRPRDWAVYRDPVGHREATISCGVKVDAATERLPGCLELMMDGESC